MTAEHDLLKTLAYFSYFGYPLTAFECWKWQYEPSQVRSYEEIQAGLRSLASGVAEVQGMYALGPVDAVCAQVEERYRRYRNAVRKEKKLRRVLAYMARLRDVRGVAICNSLPFHFTRPESDIDLFVIVRHGRLWSARFSCVGPLIALRQRPGETCEDPVDMSFFVSERALNLEALKIDAQDPYLTFWVKTLVPMLGEPGLWRAFFEANAWADASLPNARTVIRAPAARPPRRSSWMPSLPERLAERLQRHRLPEELRVRAERGTSDVVISPLMLKFHKNDRRADILCHMQELCRGALGKV